MGEHDRYLQAFLHLDIDRLSVMRAIGAGSEAARLVAMDRIMTLFGSLPDFGKQNALWDMCAETVGYRNATRYAVAPGENEKPTIDESIAQLENSALLGGGQVQVLDGQNDLVHGRSHIQAMMPLIQQAQQAPDMLMKVLPGFNSLNEHATAHVERLSTDPMMKRESPAMRQQIQQADEMIHNGLMHMQKMQRQMAKAQGLPGPNGQPALTNGAPQIGPDGQPIQGSGIDPKMQEKIRAETAYRDAKMEWLNKESQAELMRDQMKAQQELAISDAKAAAEISQRR